MYTLKYEPGFKFKIFAARIVLRANLMRIMFCRASQFAPSFRTWKEKTLSPGVMAHKHF